MRNVSSKILLCFTVAVLLFPSISCGARYDFRARGFDVYTNDLAVQKAHVERIIDVTVEEIAKAAPEYKEKRMRRVLREWRGEHDLTWHKNKFTCGASETGTCCLRAVLGLHLTRARADTLLQHDRGGR